MSEYHYYSLPVRARIKIKRELLRAPIIRPWCENRHYARLGQYAENLPWITSDRFDVFAELRDHGIAVRDATTMLPADVLKIVDRFVDRLRATTPNPRNNSLQAPVPEITLPSNMPDLPADCAPLYQWGLAEENLDLAERYIGLPVYYLGAAVRAERADGLADHGTRQWHMDIDDRRMLKIIVYLNDVGDGCGSFEYLDPDASHHAARSFRYSAGHVADEAMARVIPRSDWGQVTGPRLTSIFVDPRRLFHRVQPPTKADRYSLTFTYMSTTPLFYQTFPERRLSPVAVARLSNELTPRQRRAVMVDL
jgi:hypothetical protein